MPVKASEIRIDHRIVGSMHVLTSPDVPELYVAHADRAFAESHVQDALDMIGRARDRIASRR